MTTATARRRRSSRCASWSKATGCCCCSTRSARRPTPRSTNICNAKKVPQLFVATGATKWGDPKHFPWTMGWQPNYQSEGHIYATYLKEHQPNGKIGILYQNDDYGKDYVKGLKDGLGDKAKAMIVAELPYETTDPTVDSQIVSLKGVRRRRVLQCDDAEIRRAGDQEGGRDRLETVAPAEQRVEFGRRRAECRPVSTTPRALFRLSTSRTRPTRPGRTMPGTRHGSPSWTNTIPKATRPISFTVYRLYCRADA